MGASGRRHAQSVQRQDAELREKDVFEARWVVLKDAGRDRWHVGHALVRGEYAPRKRVFKQVLEHVHQSAVGGRVLRKKCAPSEKLLLLL